MSAIDDTVDYYIGLLRDVESELDALRARVAELEADNARLKALERTILCDVSAWIQKDPIYENPTLHITLQGGDEMPIDDDYYRVIVCEFEEALGDE